MEDKKISEAVELLYKGAKMLSYYCPECKVPLFKDKDRIFCPSCKRDVVFEKSIKDKDDQNEKKLIETAQPDKTVQPDELEKIFRNVVSNLALKLGNTDDTQNVREIVELMDKLTNLIEKLKRLRYI